MISDARKRFEAIPYIAEFINSGYYEFISDESGYYSDVEGVDVESLDLAWFVFLSQENRINKALDFTENIHSENWQESIHCIKEVLK